MTVTASELVVEARNVAQEKATAMGQAGVTQRAQEYAALEFTEVSANIFEALDPNGDTGLIDMVLDQVEQKFPIEFSPFRHGGGKQTVYWNAA